MPFAPAAIEVRAFFVKDGATVEDPVTGSLNASLAQWLLGSGRGRVARAGAGEGGETAASQLGPGVAGEGAAPGGDRPTNGQETVVQRRRRPQQEREGHQRDTEGAHSAIATRAAKLGRQHRTARGELLRKNAIRTARLEARGYLRLSIAGSTDARRSKLAPTSPHGSTPQAHR